MFEMRICRKDNIYNNEIFVNLLTIYAHINNLNFKLNSFLFLTKEENIYHINYR